MIVKRRPFRKISWGAIFAGVLAALVVQMILSFLGLAVGFGSINPMSEANPFSGLGTGALVWWVASMLISLFVGGLTAGRLSGVYVAFDRVLHGFLTFSAYSIVSFFLVTTAIGGIISGVGTAVGKSLAYTGQDKELQSKAREMADNFQQRAGAGALSYDSLKQNEPEARRTGQDIASTASKVSMYAFIGLVLGAVVAGAGSGVGRPKREISEIETEDDYSNDSGNNSGNYSQDYIDRQREMRDAELRERELDLRERESILRQREKDLNAGRRYKDEDIRGERDINNPNLRTGRDIGNDPRDFGTRDPGRDYPNRDYPNFPDSGIRGNDPDDPNYRGPDFRDPNNRT